MPYIDVSPDDKTIAYTFYDTLSSSIYEFSLVDSAIVRITKSTEDHYFQPKYSPDGKKVMMLAARLKGKKYPRILIYNKTDSTIRQVSDDNSLITKAVFSRDGAGIYYIAASSYGNYSPVANAGSHGNDIYYIDTNGNNLKKITHINAYGMSGIAISKDGEKIYSDIWVLDEDKKKGFSGLYEFSVEKQELLQKIVVENKMLRKCINQPTDTFTLTDCSKYTTDYNCYFSPVISPDGITIIINKLITINIETKQGASLKDFLCDEKLDVGNISSPSFYNFQHKIAFIQSAVTRSAIASVELGPKIIVMDLATKQITARYNLDNKHVIPDALNN